MGLPPPCLRPVAGVDTPRLLDPGVSSCPPLLLAVPSLTLPSPTNLGAHLLGIYGRGLGWSNWSAPLLDNAFYCVLLVQFSLYPSYLSSSRSGAPSTQPPSFLPEEGSLRGTRWRRERERMRSMRPSNLRRAC